MTYEKILLLALICVNVLFFCVGYLFGKLKSFDGVFHSAEKKPKSFFQNQKEQPVSKVSIDSTKIVTNINTDGLQKKYNDLGTQKESSEDITSSINKLKNMKG